MYCTFLLFAGFLICQISSEPIQRIITDYFNSESVRKFRNEWEKFRKPLEHAITIALTENVGYTGMNVYIRRQNQDLAGGFYHNDNQVRLVLTNVRLQELPRFWLPEVQFSLASNVLKIHSLLNKIIIHADYALVRNKSSILHEPKDQDPYKSSPFLFQQVSDVGKVAITMDSCKLLGFIIASLSGESVNLGYDHLRLLQCKHTFEIYRPGDDSPPVITKYNPFRDNDGLRLTELLLKPLSQELVPKMQAAMFTFINTSSIFEEDLRDFRENQDVVFQSTWSYLTDIVRKLNKITVQKNGGAIDMKSTTFYWEDGNIKFSKNKTDVGQSITISNVVLTGVDTLYCAHSGGPYKMKTFLIGDEIRFSTLQIRGYLDIESTTGSRYGFAVEIHDMAVDLQLDVNPDKEDQESKKKGYKTLEVVGFRRMVFTAPTLQFAPAEALVQGYLMNEVPKILIAHLKSIFPEAMGSPKQPESAADPCKDNVPKKCPGSYETTCTNPDTNKICKTKCKSADCVCKPGFVSTEDGCVESRKFNEFDERTRLRHLRRKGSKKHERNNKIRK